MARVDLLEMLTPFQVVRDIVSLWSRHPGDIEVHGIGMPLLGHNPDHALQEMAGDHNFRL
jgi:hypothetical protein